MAWRSDSVFELRPSGSSANGVGFSAALGGTDYSQSDSPIVSVSDGVTNGTTTVTSASANFTAPLLGNGLNIAGDNDYQILAVNSATSVTVDRNTANGGAGRSMKVGGAGTIQNAAGGFDPIVLGILASGHKMWVRRTNAAGVDTIYNPVFLGQPGLTVSGSVINPITTEGYGAVRGDGGRPIISMNGWAFNLSGAFNIVKNLQIQGLSGSAPGFHFTSNQCHIENILVDPTGTTGVSFLAGGTANVNLIRRCSSKPNPSASADVAFEQAGFGNVYEYCDFSGSGGGAGIRLNAEATFRNCVMRDNHLSGMFQNGNTGPAQFFGCLFWNNGTDGVLLQNATIGLPGWVFENCIFGMNGGYDLNYTPSDLSTTTGAIEWAKTQLRCNWFYTTGTGRYHNLPAAPDDTALTVNPFVASASGNFNLNSLAGGGAAITGKPCVTAFADGVNTASTIAGFYGTVPATSGLVSLRNLWREKTNERFNAANNSGIPDATVDIFLLWGSEWLNRKSRYHYTTTTLTLVAGQQEYIAPFPDLLELKFVRWGMTELQKGDTERWRGDDLQWSQEPAADPREFAQYGLNIILRPTPSANAVAENPTCTVRYVSNPVTPDDQLPLSGYKIVVDYAAAIWNLVYPSTMPDLQTRAAGLLKEAQEAADLFIGEQGQRGIGR